MCCIIHVHVCMTINNHAVPLTCKSSLFTHDSAYWLSSLHVLVWSIFVNNLITFSDAVLDLCIIYFTSCFSTLDVAATLHPLLVALNMMKMSGGGGVGWGWYQFTYLLFIYKRKPSFRDSSRVTVNWPDQHKNVVVTGSDQRIGAYVSLHSV